MIDNKPKDIDEYITAFPDHVQKMLQQIRATIQKAAPDAKEAIKYAMPTFTQKGNLIHFAAFKNHIGLYAAPTANLAFGKELSGYKCGKGAIQLSLDKPLPLELIGRMVQYRVEQDALRK